MRTVLVTGSTGSLGEAVVCHLHQGAGYSVIATSRSSKDSNTNLDVSNTGQMADLIHSTRPEIIFHLAATFINDFDRAYAVNVEATKNLLEIVQQSGLNSRVLLIGSAAEYGAIYPEENPVGVDHVLNPVSVYGLTKAWQTQLAGLYSSRGVDVVVARVFNLDGKNISEKLFVGRLQKQIGDVLAGRQSVIELGPLNASRDYITVDDAADQLLMIAEHGQSGSIYHVASGKAVIMRDILIRKLKENKLDISIVRESAELSNRSGYDVPIIYADITKTQQLKNMRVGTDSV